MLKIFLISLQVTIIFFVLAAIIIAESDDKHVGVSKVLKLGMRLLFLSLIVAVVAFIKVKFL